MQLHRAALDEYREFLSTDGRDSRFENGIWVVRFFDYFFFSFFCLFPVCTTGPVKREARARVLFKVARFVAPERVGARGTFRVPRSVVFFERSQLCRLSQISVENFTEENKPGEKKKDVTRSREPPRDFFTFARYIVSVFRRRTALELNERPIGVFRMRGPPSATIRP